MRSHYKKVSAAGLLIALGIIYGDIGTSPLYTFQTILTDGGSVNKGLVFGAISCIFWTLTLQTTFKYVKEIVMTTTFPAIHKDATNDFKFVILERFLSYDNEFPGREGFILNSYFSIIKLARSDSEAYGIDSDLSVIEKVPLVVAPMTNISLIRAFYKTDEKGN